MRNLAAQPSGRLKIQGRVKITTSKGEVLCYNNNVSTEANSGTDLMTQLMAGMPASIEITGIQFGTGTGAETSEYSNLETPVGPKITTRKILQRTTTVIQVEFFASHAELPDNTYTEVGLFCGDRMFARALLSPSFTKVGRDDITIDYTIILSST